MPDQHPDQRPDPRSGARPAGADPAETLPRPLLVVLIALPVVLVAGVLLAAAVVRDRQPGPLRLAEVPAPQSGSADCTRLLAALPGELDGGEQGPLPRRPLVAPAPQGAAAWGDPPVVLRCGLDRPDQLTTSSRLLSISGVQFLELAAPDSALWTVVDRPVYVAVSLPPDSGSAPVQQLAELIGTTLPPRPPDLTP